MFEPQNGKSDVTTTSRPPLWETLVMAGSFVAIWAWYLLRQSALRAEQTPSPLGSVLLVIALPLLVWVFARRMRRTLDALHEVHPAGRGPRERN